MTLLFRILVSRASFWKVNFNPSASDKLFGNHVTRFQWRGSPTSYGLFWKPHYTFSERNWNVNWYQRCGHLQVRSAEIRWHLTKQKVAKSCFALLELKVGLLFYGNSVYFEYMNTFLRQIVRVPAAFVFFTVLINKRVSDDTQKNSNKLNQVKYIMVSVYRQLLSRIKYITKNRRIRLQNMSYIKLIQILSFSLWKLIYLNWRYKIIGIIKLK